MFPAFIDTIVVSVHIKGDFASGPDAHFDNVPHKSILTLNVLPPEGWLVESVSAVHDLDNIKLEQVGNAVMVIQSCHADSRMTD